MYREILKPDFDLEQHFWTPSTVNTLLRLITRFRSIACLSCPTLGLAIPVRTIILDVDRRFARYPNYVAFNIVDPHRINRNFDLIVADPPMSLVNAEQVKEAIEILSGRITKLIIVDSSDGRLYIDYFPERNLEKIAEANYNEEQTEQWYFWSDINQ